MERHMTRLKGARLEVLRTIRDQSVNGICTISINSLAEITAYCPAAVKYSIRYLIEQNVIKVTKQAGDSRNSYLVGATDAATQAPSP
jgi:hypothetical protein